jgi:hypothetical protein
MKIEILSPSYHRAASAFTQEYIPECRYVVAEDEAEKYVESGKKIITCPVSAQGNLCRVRNWILDNTEADGVLILDDDISALGMFEGNKSKKFTGPESVEFIKRGFYLAREWGVRFWGVNIAPDKVNYREYTPFSTVAYIGGPFQGHINNPCRYDERLALKEDYDMTLQVLNKFRAALRFNMVFYVAKQNEQVGGCSTYRTSERERDHYERLRKKWGSHIVQRDGGENKAHARRRSAEVHQDINPIIRAPIGGI